jgi:hypothetical protein
MALKSWIIQQEPHDIPVPWTDISGKSFDVPPRQRAKPAQVPACCCGSTRHYSIDTRVTSEKSRSQGNWK